MSFVTLREAASYLGVSTATLRNWDKAGKLRAVRHPLNNYRVYTIEDLRQIQSQLPAGEQGALAAKRDVLDARSTRSLISRLHNILRDSDSHSNIIERFDELNKLLFLKLNTEADTRNLLARQPQETDARYAARIRTAYLKLARRNRKIIPRAFSQITANDKAVCACAAALSHVSFRNVGLDIKGLAYEEVIKNTFDKNDNQQFFTPPPLVTFMVEMMRPYLAGDICDPAAGTGGFLVEVHTSGAAYTSLTALEIDERLAWVSGVNLVTHGAQRATSMWLKNAGALGNEAKKHLGTFDAIITNPPFGSDLSDPRLLSTYTLGGERGSRRRGILFLERCYHLLKPGGHLGIIIDEGVLNGTSTEDVRRFITDHFDVQAIVSLPESAFMPYATVNASVLFLRKRGRKRVKAHDTFFAKAEVVGRKGNGDDDVVYDESGASRLNSDLPNIVSLYQSFLRTNLPLAAETAFTANIEENLRTEDSAWRLDFRYHHPSRKRSSELLAQARCRLMTLGQICAERNKTFIPSTEMEGQTILYTGLAHIESGTGIAHQVPTPAAALKSAVKAYEPGDIIFAKMRPNLRKVAFIEMAQPGYASPECIVLFVRRNEAGLPIFDPLLLSILLRSDFVYGQIMHLIAGIGRPRLSAADLRRVQIPVISHAEQLQLRALHLAAMSASTRLKDKAADLLREAAAMERGAVEKLARELIQHDS